MSRHQITTRYEETNQIDAWYPQREQDCSFKATQHLLGNETSTCFREQSTLIRRCNKVENFPESSAQSENDGMTEGNAGTRFRLRCDVGPNVPSL